MDTEFKPGDYVVGRYSEMGKPIKPGKVHGDADDIANLQQMILDHGGRSGGRALKKETLKKESKGKVKKEPKAKKVNYPAEPVTMADVRATMKARFQEDTEVEEMVHAQSAKEYSRKKTVHFYNALGKIKLVVDEVLESPMAFCLIFKNEDDIVFTPKVGETLNFINSDGEDYSVYYPDTLFTWIDHTKQLMILFKNDE